jgi:hypothetical protein
MIMKIAIPYMLGHGMGNTITHQHILHGLIAMTCGW